MVWPSNHPKGLVTNLGSCYNSDTTVLLGGGVVRAIQITIFIPRTTLFISCVCTMRVMCDCLHVHVCSVHLGWGGTHCKPIIL